MTSVVNQTAVLSSGVYMNGATPPGPVNDSDQGYDPLTSYDQGSSAGGYVVHDGDTLSGIAAALWGDASLWYKLAEANGLGRGDMK